MNKQKLQEMTILALQGKLDLDTTNVLSESKKQNTKKESKILKTESADTNIDKIKSILKQSGIVNENTLNLMSKDVLNTLKRNYSKDCEDNDGNYYDVAITSAIQDVIQRITGSRPQLKIEAKERSESMVRFYKNIISMMSENLGISENEFKLEDNDRISFVYEGKHYFAAPRSTFQIDIFDGNNNQIGWGVAATEVKQEVFTEHNKETNTYQLVGGKYAGTYTYKEVTELPIYEDDNDDTETKNARANGGLTRREELDDQPRLRGYLGPMWDGVNDDGSAIIRYETQDVYDMLSESKRTSKYRKVTESSLDDKFQSTINWYTTNGYEIYKQEDGITALVNKTVDKRGPVCVIFKGKSSKPVSRYVYPEPNGMDRIDTEIDKYISRSRERAESNAKRREQRKLTKDHDVKVGDIYYTSWGYDQTNSEFYQVVDVRGARIDLKEIASKYLGNSYQEDEITASPDNFVDDRVYTVSARADGTLTPLQGKYFLQLYKWNGKSIRVTDAYSGH